MEKEAQNFIDLFKPAGTIVKQEVEKPVETVVESDELFETKSNIDDVKTGIFNRLANEYSDILTKAKPSTKCYQAAFNYMSQFIDGTFLFANDWDKGWYTKVTNKYPLEDIVWTAENLEKRCDKVLHYLRCTPNHFWRKSKHNMAEFFCSRMRNGKYWSPFLEILSCDCTTLEMYKNLLGDKLFGIVDDTLNNVWFIANNDVKRKFCGGVMTLYSWYSDNREEIIRKSPENAIWLHSFESLLELIKLCNEETKFLYPSYTNPWMKNWSTFTTWANKRGCAL